MKITQESIFHVENPNNCMVCVESNRRSYSFPSRSETGEVTSYPMPWSEIEYIDSHTRAFRNALLGFKEPNKDDIYNALGFSDWKERLLFNDEIENIIINPSVEGLNKLLLQTDLSVVSRIYGIMKAMERSNTFDISNRVIEIIEKRYDEINRGVVKSSIKLSNTSLEKEKSEVDMLREQLSAMQKQMQELLGSINHNSQKTPEDKNHEPEKTAKPQKSSKTKNSK